MVREIVTEPGEILHHHRTIRITDAVFRRLKARRLAHGRSVKNSEVRRRDFSGVVADISSSSTSVSTSLASEAYALGQVSHAVSDIFHRWLPRLLCDSFNWLPRALPSAIHPQREDASCAPATARQNARIPIP